MQVESIPPANRLPQVNTAPPVGVQSEADADSATDAFGLSFESFLQIVLQQLTFQDPLEPMDNFEFVSQLAQFSQIQQTQSLNDKIDGLLASQSTVQATSLLGRTVDIPTGAATLSGVVSAVSFSNGEPRVSIETSDDQTISNIAISSISQIREEQ